VLKNPIFVLEMLLQYPPVFGMLLITAEIFYCQIGGMIYDNKIGERKGQACHFR
jgi:hypothetical protein